MPTPTKSEIAMQQRHERLMNLIEQPYIRSLIRCKNKYITDVSKAYRIEESIPEDLTLKHEKEMFKIQAFYSNKTIKIFAKDISNEFQKNVALNFKESLEKKNFNKWLKTIIGFWIDEEVAESAKVTALTTRDDIKKAVEVSLKNGELSAQTAKMILKVKGFSPFRSETIALTETHNAAMYANKESGKRFRREAGGSLLKIWIPVQDTRTRETHASMVSHTPVSMDSFFSVGNDKMDRPGDPRGSAKNLIRCRCTMAYRVEE